MKTAKVTQSDLKKSWVIVDAKDLTLGRISTQIAHVLLGKHKANFCRHLDNGDYVVVVNAERIKLTGNKLKSKTYFHHSTYVGGIKAARADEVLAKHPKRIIETAVKGMLPKNALGRKLFMNLKVYAGEAHPHAAQNPGPLPSRLSK